MTSSSFPLQQHSLFLQLSLRTMTTNTKKKLRPQLPKAPRKKRMKLRLLPLRHRLHLLSKMNAKKPLLQQ